MIKTELKVEDENHKNNKTEANRLMAIKTTEQPNKT